MYDMKNELLVHIYMFHLITSYQLPQSAVLSIFMGLYTVLYCGMYIQFLMELSATADPLVNFSIASNCFEESPDH